MNICDSIERIRPIGKVTCSIFHGVQVLPKKKRLIKSGFVPLPDEYWVPIKKEEAQKLILQSICYHLEDDEKILEESKVFELISSFVESFSDESRFVTNFDGSFECISHSYLDIAVVIENSKGVLGLICIEDSH